jgi:hypothetical protein
MMLTWGWCVTRLEFERQVLPSIAVYAYVTSYNAAVVGITILTPYHCVGLRRVQPLGVPSDDIEAESGPSLCTVLSHTTEVRVDSSFSPMAQLSLLTVFTCCCRACYSGPPYAQVSRAWTP